VRGEFIGHDHPQKRQQSGQRTTNASRFYTELFDERTPLLATSLAPIPTRTNLYFAQARHPRHRSRIGST
jgi:hypothetical protein